MKQTITPGYAKLLKQNHAEFAAPKGWGHSGARNVGDKICAILRARRGKIRTVLDFGAGQCSLEQYVRENYDEPISWTNYDPGIEGIDELPEGKFDLIVSSDVLEHIEPDMLDNVIKWLIAHTGKWQFHWIACDPCLTTLPDGRNAHLIQESPQWWREYWRGMLKPNSLIHWTAEQKSSKIRTKNYCSVYIQNV
jgi:cyclopropane fatty-acyl-phospholipid synthase-like methyltransferase